MKKTALLSFMTFAMLTVHAQTWQWAISMGGTDSDIIGISCVDLLNNLYFTGAFSNDFVFGSDTLLSGSVRTPFIAKVTAAGSAVWAKKAEGIEMLQAGSGITVYFDSYSNALFAWSRMSGPNQSIGDCVLLSNGQMGDYSNYLTKLDLDGNCDWTIHLNSVRFMTLVSDGQGCLYGIIRITPGSTFGTEFLTTGQYLVKLRSLDGSVLWTKQILDSVNTSVEISYSQGSLWINGNTGGDTEFILDTVTLDTYPNDIYVSKFDTTSGLQWVHTFGGEDIENTSHISVDVEGDSYVSGRFGGEAYFGDTTLNTSSGADIFIMKLDGQGNRLWVRQSISSAPVSYNKGISDSMGNSVICGKFTGIISFGTYTLTASSAEDGFVVKYDSAGTCIGARSIGNIGWGGIVPAIDNNGTVLVAGSFEGTTDFDGTVLTSIGYNDVFVAKIDLVTSVPAARMDGSNELLIHANPNEGKCTITVPDGLLNERNLVLRIFDSSGRLIRETPLAMNEGKIQLSLEQEARGIYTATLSSSEKTYSGRIVFE